MRIAPHRILQGRILLEETARTFDSRHTNVRGHKRNMLLTVAEKFVGKGCLTGPPWSGQNHCVKFWIGSENMGLMAQASCKYNNFTSIRDQKGSKVTGQSKKYYGEIK